MEGFHEVVRVEIFSRRPEHGVAPILAGPGAEDRLYQVASRYLVERAAGYEAFEVVPELVGYQVPQHVVVVVDGRYRYVDLGRPVRLVASG